MLTTFFAKILPIPMCWACLLQESVKCYMHTRSNDASSDFAGKLQHVLHFAPLDMGGGAYDEVLQAAFAQKCN